MKTLPELSKPYQNIHSYGWRHKLRQSVAHRASFRCEKCHVFLGMHGQVDHIIARRELEEQGGSPWDADNLQYLCAPCHSKKTNAERWKWAGRREGPKPWNRTKVNGRKLMLAMAGVKP